MCLSSREKEPSPERLQLAFDTLTRYFEELSKAIDSQKTRAGNLVTISAFIVTFASAAGLIGKDTSTAFPEWASLTLWGIIVCQVLAVMYVLLPHKYKRGADVRKMMKEDADPWLTKERIEELSNRLDSTRLKYRNWGYLYQFALVCLVAEVTVILFVVVVTR
ncbi:hypothetical protein [Streptomyces bobili]|uniref:Integral membrane protein n=1 Tax=Streptomyces bobili TaxID=67280 RepID=A0ABZ1R3M5_9ACTN|nr:hypothetical protein [Streptomyces bobili]